VKHRRQGYALAAIAVVGVTAGADYFPPGTFSGIYAPSSGGVFSQNPVDGDTLPQRLTDAELRAALS
jgi:hypothetical protein